MGWIIGFGVTSCQTSGVEYKKKKKKKAKKKLTRKYQNPAFSRVNMLIVVVQNPKIHSIF